MQKEWNLNFEDHLAADSSKIWRIVSTMSGVNRELMPIMRMTYPNQAKEFDLTQAPTGKFLFKSWILLFGIIPIDRHHLRLTRVEPGCGFLEESVSWSQTYWRHERILEPTSQGCLLIDRLTFRPRLQLIGPVIAWFVRHLFEHRHAQLRKNFGLAGEK